MMRNGSLLSLGILALWVLPAFADVAGLCTRQGETAVAIVHDRDRGLTQEVTLDLWTQFATEATADDPEILPLVLADIRTLVTVAFRNPDVTPASMRSAVEKACLKRFAYLVKKHP